MASDPVFLLTMIPEVELYLLLAGSTEGMLLTFRVLYVTDVARRMPVFCIPGSGSIYPAGACARPCCCFATRRSGSWPSPIIRWGFCI